MSYRAEHVRIFLASPSDVADERALALRIVGELGYDPSLRGRVTLETIAWDQPKAGTALLANVTPQAAISAGLPRPSECDIVVVILWSRMGTPLPSQYQKSDGSGYLSGTEYEFEDALAACREHGRPFILLYRRVDTPATMLDDPFITEKLAQYQLVKDFFLRFTEKESGALLAGINHYENPSAFAKSLEIHLRQLLERMLRDMPLSSPVSPVGSFTQPVWTGSPFPGLRALSPKDAPIFFGRGYETDALIKRINVPTSRFLAVVGASGSGKSSLVGAGLIPRLQAIPDDTHWLVLNFTPDYLGSGNPFAALGAALLRDLPSINSRGLVGKLQSAPGHLAALLSQVVSTEGQPTRLLVFVDQFEELFTTVEPRLRDGFIESLTQVVQCQYITTIVTLRGDFYGKCVEIPVLAKLLEDSTFPLSAPGVVALLEMISYPAKRAGVQFEDGLVERILEDTGDEPGALPLMAYTLDELYRAAGDGRPITHSAYEALGGVQGAIGKRSEEVFSTLLDDERAELPHVFRELVEVDERGTATRQRARLQDCAQTTAADSLVHALADARLLVLSKDERNEPYVEVAHEALLQSWERLAQWISETEDDLRLLRQVRLATREWEENGRRDDYLWSQERLEPVYEMQYRLQVVFEPSVRDFVRPETDRLLEDFQADNRYFRQRPIIERLAEIGPRSAPILVTCLADAATVSSLNDIKGALRRFGAPAIVELVSALNGNNNILKMKVCEVLGDLGDSSVAPLLGGLLHDSDIDLCIAAARALGRLGSPDALPLLIPILQHSEDRVRKSAVDAVGKINSPEVVSVLLSALANSSKSVRSSAVTSIGVFGDAAPRTSYGETSKQRRGKYYDIIKDSHGSQVLMRILHDPDEGVRRSAATALGKLADSSSVSALGECINDVDPDVSSSAVYALAVIGDPAIIPLLVSALTSQHATTRTTSARMLGVLGASSQGRNQLLYTDVQSLSHRIGVLHNDILTSGAVSALANALTDKDADVRKYAAESLGMISETTAVPSLVAALQDKDPYVRQSTSKALRRIGDKRATTALIEALDDSDQFVLVNAIEALQVIGDVASVPALLRLLERNTSKRGYYVDRVIQGALLTIDKLAIEEAALAARLYTNHPDRDVRRTALGVLTRYEASKHP